MATLKNTDINDTGYLKLPVGTTAERPVSPQTGYIRYNSTTQIVELYNGIVWVDLTISFLTIDGEVYIDNTVLLLQGDDNPSDVTQNNTFKDSSTNNFTITRNGNVTQGTFSPFDRALTNSGGSAYFDGTGDFLTVPNNSAFNLGSNNFTAEFWVYLPSLPNNYKSVLRICNTSINISNDEGLLIEIDNTNKMTVGIYVAASGFFITETNAMITDSFIHYAFVRNNNTLTLYRNGTSVGTNSISGSMNFTTSFITIIGRWSNQTSRDFNGYISNLRVVKGTAVYTSNFNPSTIPLTAITNTSLLLNFTNAAIFDGVKLNNIETVGGAQINTSIKKYGTGSLAFDGNGDYLSIPSTSNLNLGSDNFTIEGWIYLNNLNDAEIIGLNFNTNQSSYSSVRLVIEASKIKYYISTGSGWGFIGTGGSNLVVSTWYHFSLVRNGGTVTLYVNGTSIATSTTLGTSSLYFGTFGSRIGNVYWSGGNLYLNGYIDDLRITKGIAIYTSNFNTNLPGKLSSLIPNYLVSRSLRFNSADSAYLTRTPTVAGNRQTWTWSGWIKRGAFNGLEQYFMGYSISGIVDGWYIGDGNQLVRWCVDNSGMVTRVNLISSPIFRDPGAWYHIMITQDTTQSIDSNRVKVYVNGIQITSWTTAIYPSQNWNSYINSNLATTLFNGYCGAFNNGYCGAFNGYASEINFIDGQALTPDSFGIRNTSTGVWSPKEYTGTYGTNGFHLNFSDITQIGRDFSGNNNNWTPNNFSVTPGVGYDSLTDVPTPNGTDNGFGGEVRGNYATWNPTASGTGATLTNGNLDYSLTGAASINRQTRGTFLIPTFGKWYWETLITLVGETAIGVVDIQTNLVSYYYRYDIGGWQNIYINSVQTAAVVGFTTNDIIGVGYDSDNQQIRFYKNGVQVGTNYSLPNTKNLAPYAEHASGTSNCAGSTNFGQRPFVYQAPTGFKTLNTANLPTPVIGGGGESNLANKYMDITTYTGTGTDQSIFNSGFKPDFVWIKSRSAATSHAIYDNIRGVQKRLSSDSTAAEVTDTTGLSSFDNTGFSIGALSQINTSGATYVAWQWRAGNTVSSNTSGTITSQVRVSTLSGFSIVGYTGTGNNATVGHGLGVTPKMVIVKGRGVNGTAWPVIHTSVGSNGQFTYLHSNVGIQTVATVFNSLYPNNSVFNIGTSGYVNALSEGYVAYCFAEIDGYSKFGSYLGNNSTDGTFVYTGFKPKYILIKCSSTTGNWVLYNSIVNTGNPVVNELFANTNNAENSVTTNDEIDFLSNGFKTRSTNAAINAVQTYIYAAFAETPFKYATASLTLELKETILVDYLVVAGGGGGGADGWTPFGQGGGGGGGAGGYRAFTNQTLNIGTSYTIIVGAGGGGSINGTESTAVSGNNSVFNLITSTGGGGGGFSTGSGSNGGNGGSGGGGGGLTSGSRLGGTGNTPSTSPSQGNNGGSNNPNTNYGSGGGGGAGSVGSNGGTNASGNGGIGVQNTITGIIPTPYYAGGGGGGTNVLITTGGNGDGGSGGGGNGGNNSVAANNGNSNTGGGGGGAGYSSNGLNGGSGGSGVVIVKYPNTYPDLTLNVGIQYATSNGTVTTNVVSTGVYTPSYTPTGFKVYEFRGTGGVPLNISWQK